MNGQITITDWLDSVAMDFKIEAVYQKLFGVKKFRNLIRDGRRDKVIAYLRFQGNYGLGCGWSEKNSTIINLSKTGMIFNYDGREYSFDVITDFLIAKYGNHTKHVGRNQL